MLNQEQAKYLSIPPEGIDHPLNPLCHEVGAQGMSQSILRQSSQISPVQTMPKTWYFFRNNTKTKKGRCNQKYKQAQINRWIQKWFNITDTLFMN